MRTIAATLKNDIIYFSPMFLNGVFSLDLRHGNEVKGLNIFEREKGVNYLYRRAYFFDDNIWFVPEQADYVARFDIVTNEIETYRFPCHKQILNGMFKYSDSFVISDKYLCLVPGNTDALVIIDMETGKEKILYDVVDPEKESYVSGTYSEGYVWMCPFNSECLLRVDMVSGKTKKYKWKYGKEAFDGICVVDKNIYFAPYKSDVFLSINTEKMEENVLDISNIKQQNEKFQGIFRVDNELWCMPFTAKYYLRYDIVNKKIKKYIGNDEEMFQNREGEINNIMPVSLHEKIILASCLRDSFSFYDKIKDEFNRIEIKLMSDEAEAYYNKCLKAGILTRMFRKDIVRETEGMLDFLCSNISELCD